jgi:type IV pilus assembly protein PilV
MTGPSRLQHHESGAYLLEALIGILIFSLGVLGIVGLQAESLRSTSDDALRAEAVLAANQYIGQMWTDNVDDPNILPNNYSTASAGPQYVNFVNKIQTAFGGAYDPAYAPSVTFTADFVPGSLVPLKQPSSNSKYVEIQIWWKSCSTPGCTDVGHLDHHSYYTSAVIGTN